MPAEPSPRDPGRATSFGGAADAYQRSRPDYPSDLVAWLVDGAERVVDVGAGTGKLTAVLRGLGHQVTAVDPDPRMLEALSQRDRDVETHVGSAESLPLPDDSADVITFGQAWHWVDPGPASIEVARVLAPGGVLGLIWNLRDDSVDWVEELTAIIKPSAAEQLLSAGPPPYGAPFGAVEHRSTRWTYTLTPGQLVDLASSRSHLLALPFDEREQVLAEVAALGSRVADADGKVQLPYSTEAFRISIPS